MIDLLIVAIDLLELIISASLVHFPLAVTCHAYMFSVFHAYMFLWIVG